MKPNKWQKIDPEATFTDESHIDEAVLKLESRLERTPPQSLEAEQALLGGLLIDPAAFDQVSDLIKPDDFYRHPHCLIYSAFVKLKIKDLPIDIITVSEQLLDDGNLDQAGGRGYVSDLAMSILTTENIRIYAQMIADAADLRRLILAANEIAALAYDAEDKGRALEIATKKIMDIERKKAEADLISIGEGITDIYETISKRAENPGKIAGVKSGFYNLDKYTNGFGKGDLVILAARPSMGKTALALNIAANAAIRDDKTVLIFSLEMSRDQLIERIILGESETDGQRARSGYLEDNDYNRMAAVIPHIEYSSLYIDDTPGLTHLELASKVRRKQAEIRKPIDLIVIDYLQLMESSDASENETVSIGKISRALKKVAKAFECAVICLSQLSRAVEARQDKRPMMSDLRQSGAIEQDADIVMFIYRDEYYNKETERPGTADIIIAKQRNGPVGEVSLLFRHNITKFVNPLDSKYNIGL